VGSARDHTRQYLQSSAEVQRRTAEVCADQVAAAAARIAETVSGGGTILLCGNGGSAADCQHVAAEFVSRLSADFVRPAIAAIALTTDTSFLTAYTNDFDFDGVFARQVEALGRTGDVLIGISTSGRSRNVLRAAETAKRKGLAVVVLMGESGELEKIADVAIKIPSRSTQHIQESMLSIEHIICHLVERQVFGGGGTPQASSGGGA
jgi:D-sedoheptulose 7-phosphate isomerase